MMDEQPPMPRWRPSSGGINESEPAVFDAHSAEWGMQMRAVTITRRMFGISQAEMVGRWGPRQDQMARRILNMLQNGEPIPNHWRGYQAPPAIDPISWIKPRQQGR